jgi:hypothetical protein
LFAHAERKALLSREQITKTKSFTQCLLGTTSRKAGVIKLTLLILSLSACADRMTVEEKLRHRAVECVYVDTGKVCKERPAQQPEG